MHFVDLGESFPTHIYLQKLASIQPRTSLVKFARSPRAQIPQVLVRGARVLRAEPVPEVELLPSDDVPSDHLPLVAELAAN